jgi:hypothetical protein
MTPSEKKRVHDVSDSIKCPVCTGDIERDNDAFKGVMINAICSRANDAIMMNKQLMELKKINNPTPAEFKLKLEVEARMLKAEAELQALIEIKKRFFGLKVAGQSG